MALDQFNQAEKLLNYLSFAPIEAEAGDPRNARELLSGIDYLCRTPFEVLRNVLTPRQWKEFPVEDRQQMVAAYASLEDSADPLFEYTGMTVLTSPLPHLPEEVRIMARQSEAAQQIAKYASACFEHFQPAITHDNVVDFTCSALRTMVSWRREQEYLGTAGSARHPNNNFEVGLSIVQNIFWDHI